MTPDDAHGVLHGVLPGVLPGVLHGEPDSRNQAVEPRMMVFDRFAYWCSDAGYSQSPEQTRQRAAWLQPSAPPTRKRYLHERRSHNLQAPGRLLR